jgi:type 1 glutamine amidotransferase
MKTRFASFIIPFISLLLLINHHPANKKVLIFCKTAGYHHSSIANGIKAIQELGNKNNFLVDTTTNAELFTTANLKQYTAVIFLSTTGDVLNAEQQKAFEGYIKSGGGFAGVHAATDTEYDWPWYGNLVGAWFKSHPAQQTATLDVVDQKSIATKHLPPHWARKDEWYNFKWMTSEKLNVLIKIDEKSYNPGDGGMGDNHPMSWYHDFDGGRSFYTELGHTDESWVDPLYLQHLLGGIEYAMGAKME